MLFTILVFLIILSVLVLVHELGHFLVAKKLGIKVEEFGFGFPPRVFGKKIGETVYSFNLLPIGGFVKLYGEDEAGSGRINLKPNSSSDIVESKRFSIEKEDIEISSSGSIVEEEDIEISEIIKVKEENKQSADLKRAFFTRPTWQKTLVVVAGVFMNFLLAVVILSFLFGYKGIPALGDKVVISEVLPNSPAKTAGVSAGDTVVSINGDKITSSEELILVTKKHLGEPITLQLKTQNLKLKTIEVTPRKNYPKDQGPMGIAIAQNVIVQKYPWYKAPFLGLKEALNESWLILSGLAAVVGQLLTHGTVPQGVAGPVGIAQLTGQLVQTGSTAVLSFVALLSLNLAILNILPIPALDGGQLFFIVIEGITRRKVNPKFESYAHAIGIAVLLSLIAIITLHDFLRIIQGQPILPQQ